MRQFKDDSQMIYVPNGRFQMGSATGRPNEQPAHTVQLDGFYMDKYEVTNGQFERFVSTNPQWLKDRIGSQYHDGDYLKNWSWYRYPSGQGDHPVVYISWYVAQAYAKWVGKRLPTEAEWEYAARGGLLDKKYPWGDKITHGEANYSGTGSKDQWSGTAPVGSFRENGYGLYDMAGNAWEWCADWYSSDYYKNSPAKKPLGPSTGSRRVIRGGSWYDSIANLRLTARGFSDPTSTSYSGGFRCVSALK